MGSIGMYKLFESLADAGDKYYASLTPGQIVHYDNGGNEYVRCEVVVNNSMVPAKQLKPIALVGEWREWDLPHRMADGTVNPGYHAKDIADGKTMHPNASNIYEYRLNNPGKIDPRPLAPISLTVPVSYQARKAQLIKGIYDIQELSRGNDVETKPIEVLRLIAKRVVEALKP